MTACRSVEYDTEGGGWAEVELEEWSSGSSLIYLADGLEPARTRVVLESKAIVSTFSLRIEFFKGGTQVSEEALQVRSLPRKSSVRLSCAASFAQHSSPFLHLSAPFVHVLSCTGRAGFDTCHSPLQIPEYICQCRRWT